MQQRLMTKHQDLLCPLRQYDCDYCRTYVSTYKDVTTNHWAVCEFYPVPCPNDCPKGSIPRNRLMEHIRSECKVKKDGKQLAEMKSQRDNLLEKLRFLQDSIERKRGEMQDAGINREQELTTALDELQEELWKKDKKISEMAAELEELQRMLHQQQGARRSDGSGGGVRRSIGGGGGGGREQVSNVVADHEEPRSDLSVGAGVRRRSSTGPADRRPRRTEGPRAQFVQTVQLPPTHPPVDSSQAPEQVRIFYFYCL